MNGCAPTHPALEMGLCGNAESEELPETDRPFVLHTYSLLAALPRQPVKEEEERDMERSSVARFNPQTAKGGTGI